MSRLVKEQFRVVYTSKDVAISSALIPGLGQLLQKRYGTAVLHFASVAAFTVAALSVTERTVWPLALLFNIWSVVEAVWWSRGRGGADEGMKG